MTVCYIEHIKIIYRFGPAAVRSDPMFLAMIYRITCTET